MPSSTGLPVGLSVVPAHFDRVAIAPGRVNLIGEHTDYNDGFVLPAAIDRYVVIAFAPRSDRWVSVRSLSFGEDDAFSLDDAARLPDGGWRNYIRGVASALQEKGYRLTGVEMAVWGNVPPGAGLSSSAALECATLGAFASASQLTIASRDKALLAQRAENRFVGVECGVMDQMASVLGRRDHALLIDCRSLDVDFIPLDLDAHGLRLVIADSAVRRQLDSSAYNERRAECAAAARRLASLLGRHIVVLRDVGVQELDAVIDKLPEPLSRRARHVVGENKRTLQAAAALRQGDFEAFGALLYASHDSLRDDFAVSCPELDLLVDLAKRMPGVVGARMTGAGFGGCTVNLVRAESLADFDEAVIEEYRRRTGLAAHSYVCRAVDGLRVVSRDDPAVAL